MVLEHHPVSDIRSAVNMHSAGTLLQNSIQAGMGLATVVAGSCEALGNSAIFLVPFSRAAAAVINSMIAPTPAMC